MELTPLELPGPPASPTSTTHFSQPHLSAPQERRETRFLPEQEPSCRSPEPSGKGLPVWLWALGRLRWLPRVLPLSPEMRAYSRQHGPIASSPRRRPLIRLEHSALQLSEGGGPARKRLALLLFIRTTPSQEPPEHHCPSPSPISPLDLHIPHGGRQPWEATRHMRQGSCHR